jgi:LacI family transcriptional regulator
MNIKEFARTIGVSPTTVSRAISGRGRINDTTRHMVLKRMEELGFTPNLNAQRLSHGRTNMIALDFGPMHDYLSDMFFVEMTRGIQDVLELEGYGVLLSGPGDVLNRWVKTRAVDGVILVGGPPNGSVPQEIVRTGIPCVVIGNSPIEGVQGVGSVVVGLQSGARQVAQFLIEHGHRHIGFLGSDGPDTVLLEFRAELERLGGALPESCVLMAGHAPRDGAQAFCRLLEQNEPLTAVFARTDGLAIGALRAAHQMGIQIPEELSLVGHDDVPFAELTAPPLTTVRVDCVELARQSTDMLFALLRDPQLLSRPQVVETSLVVRGSVAALWSVGARSARAVRPRHSRISGKPELR